MKSLSTLIKLQKTYVDEQRVMVTTLQEQLAKIDRDIQNLRQQQEEQKKLLRKNPEVALTYGEYLKESIRFEGLLHKKRRTAEYALNLALDRLAELFEEQKRYELAEKARQEEAAREEAHKETLVLDEVGSVGFVRKKKKKQK